MKTVDDRCLSIQEIDRADPARAHPTDKILIHIGTAGFKMIMELTRAEFVAISNTSHRMINGELQKIDR